MMEELVGQLMQSGEGAELLKTLQGHGLSADQATAALTAAAQGTAHHAAGDAGADISSIVTGLLGGGASTSGGLGGGLGGMLAGALGGGAGTNPLTGNVAGFVAEKTGLDPAIAQLVVASALPKLMGMITNHPDAQTAAPAGGGGLAGMLEGLLR
jgi:hypothetical protein